MSIHSNILQQYPKLNQAQCDVIGHAEGPLLVIAGPGSGKTFSLVLRALNLLMMSKATPGELVLCTFTEKAAYELQDRIASAARIVGFTGDLSELRVGTIHGICNRLLSQHRHRTPLGPGYQTLDELTQLLFIFEHFPEITQQVEAPYLGRWNTKWGAIEGLRDYFDKITEELVDVEELLADVDPFISALGRAQAAYENALMADNRIDFAHQQSLVWGPLRDDDIGSRVAAGVKYVLVDEYQDTNYVQEQVLTKLASVTGNLAVVGDEDQSLYRFRGATVRNILEFPQRFPTTTTVRLTRNYRSHEKIVTAYDRWMGSANWTNLKGADFRFAKHIDPDPDSEHPDYPAVFSIWGSTTKDEASRFAELVTYLKQEQVVSDYNQVALLLHSVRSNHSTPYIDALRDRGIPAFAPRARAYFDNDEVRLMVGCLAVLFGYHGDGRGDLSGRPLMELANYIDRCIVELGRRFPYPHPLSDTLQELTAEMDALTEGESLDLRPADYFYRFIALDPFPGLMNDANRARNLATFSQLLNAFQNYYHYTVVTYGNRTYLRWHLFNSFMRLLYMGGINEYEDPDQPFPEGHVQVMTIHQSKGLEFPVTVVGSLVVGTSTAKRVDRDLGPFYHREPFEPVGRITQFDRMRLHYVAFSRAEKLLVLTSDNAPKPYFAPIWQGLEQWPYIKKELLGAQRFAIKDRIPLKRRFSFTGDLNVYETCPRQYEFFRHFDFTPSRSAVIFFGLLVHQTIEEIHRIVLDGDIASLSDRRIRELFERTFTLLSRDDIRSIGPAAREAAFTQVMNYFTQNTDEMIRVIETEVDVSVEKDDYILVGKVDLLLGGDGKLEILDFKTSERPVDSPELLRAYERQLCTYAHILEQRHGKRPDRLLLYWTAEINKQDALMVFPFRPEMVDDAGRHFDDVVAKIKDSDFRVISPPERKICKECDMRAYCIADGLIADPDKGTRQPARAGR